MRNVYLFQPQYYVEVSRRKNYWLPYSAGCLWSYASQYQEIVDNFNLADIIYRREPPEQVLTRMIDPCYVGFSCYLWNRNYCLTLAEMIKQRWPDCVVQFGGPETSGRMLQYKYIDSIVMAEGEISFVSTLKSILHGQTPEVVYNKQRLENLDFPSPYLIGVFDNIIAQAGDVDWAMVLETNRGCPFSCTFCDWGGVTYSKIKKFNLDRVAAELAWCQQHNIVYIFCADANFGIFKERDLTIAHLIKDYAKNSQLETVCLQYSKNSTETIFEIASLMGTMSRGVTVSMQSMNPDTLVAIKRDNLDVNDVPGLLKLGEATGVGSYTELIIGLPLETLETWKSGLANLLEMGQHYSIDIWFANLLENSELNSPQTKQQYGIQSQTCFDYLAFQGDDDCAEIEETVDLVSATATMSTEDIAHGYVYGLMVINFHIIGYSQVWARYARSVHNIDYRMFYDRLFEIIHSDDIFGTIYQQTRNNVIEYLRTGRISSNKQRGHALHSADMPLHYENRQRCFELARAVAQHFGIDEYSVEQLQQHFIYDSMHEYPLTLGANFDLGQGTGDPVQYTISSKISNTENFDFYRARRKGFLKNDISITLDTRSK